MAGNLTLIGGNFQDAEGNPLNAGYLLLTLSHDEEYATGSSQIVAGLKFRITLDSTGNIPATPATKVYSNDVLVPSGSFYIVRCFKSDGTEAWAAPQNWTLAATPNPLNVGTITPSNPPGSGTNGGATLLLQTNSVNNGSQSLLNLKNGTNVTITDGGTGGITIAASGSSIGTNGFFIGPGLLTPEVVVNLSVATSFICGVTNQLVVTAFNLPATVTVTKIITSLAATSGTAHMRFGVYTSTGNLVLDSGVFTTSSALFARFQNTVTSTPISSGAYYLAQSCDSLNGRSDTMLASGGGLSILDAFNIGPVVRYGTAANAMTGGGLPATLGTITPLSTVSTLVALPIFT